MGILVDVGLQIQDFGWFKEFASLVGQLLGVTLSDAPELILLELLLGKKQRPDMVKILKLQASEQVREMLKGSMWFPCLPGPNLIQCNRSLLSDMESQVLQSKEESSFPSCWTRADACDTPCPLLVGGEVHTDSKGKALVPLVTACGSNGYGANVAFFQAKWPEVFPDACTLKSGGALLRFIEDVLNEASLP